MQENFDSPELQIKHTNSSDEKVGDLLHKERVTRRITLETISKDLKINSKYIRAIESNNYHELPAAPYIRVYIRSIATYLLLDQDEVLKRFYLERGLPEDSEKDAPEKIKISLTKEPAHKPKSFVLLIVIIGVVGAAVVLINKFGIIKQDSSLINKQDNTVTPAGSDTLFSEENNRTDPSKVQKTDTAIQSDAQSQDIVTSFKSSASVNQDSINLQIAATQDSTWLHVLCDGVPWKGYIKAGVSKLFVAKDSIAVFVEENKGILYTLNDDELKLQGNGERMFKIDLNGLEFLKSAKWRSIFKRK